MNRQQTRVLVVEDSPADALFIAKLLESHEAIELRRVDTLQLAVEVTQVELPDIILLDLTLPDSRGLVTLRRMRAAAPSVPIVALTSMDDDEVAVRAAREGAQDYLVKGQVDGRLLVRTLRNAIERARVEEELRESEERFRILVDSMADRVFTVDHEGRCTGVYGQWLREDGRSEAQYIGKTLDELIGPAAAEPHHRARARVMAGERVVFEWSTPQGGSVRHFSTSLSPMRDHTGRITSAVGLTREVTEHKLLQERLLLAERMTSMGQLAAGVAHEINNPLAAVLTNLDVACRELAEVEAAERSSPGLTSLREELEEARESADRVRQIVRDLKVFSRPDEQVRDTVDLRQVVESSIRLAWNEIRHRARLVREYGPTPLVHASESRLGQVCLNLLLNAAQAIPEGNAASNTISVRVGGSESGEVFLEVRDTGTGISPEVGKRIFEPFFTTKPVGVGTGLGLAICQRIISDLGGRITYVCPPAGGTVFRVTLGAADLGTVARPPAAPALRRQNGRILAIDDEPSVLRALKRVLGSHHRVETAARSREVLQRLSAGERFDVLLCDLMMPDMTGEELHRELARSFPEMAERTVFMTGGAFTHRAREFLTRVRNPRLEKPFDVDALLDLMSTFVR